MILSFHDCDLARFEGPAIVKPPALPEDTYFVNFEAALSRYFTRSRCGMISPEVSCEQEALFLVYCNDGCSRCSTRTGEIAISGRSTNESDYRKRMRSLFVSEQRGNPCGAENDG